MNRLLLHGAVIALGLVVCGTARAQHHGGHGHGGHGHGGHGYGHHGLGHLFGGHHFFHPYVSFGFGYPYPAYPYVYEPYYYYSPRYTYAYPRASSPAYYYDPGVVTAEPRSGSAVPAPPRTATTPKAARIEVRVPDPDAEVLFDGKRTSAVGRVRQFDTGELEPGESYSARITARWRRDGRDMTDAREVDLRAGTSAVVDFTQTPPVERVATPSRSAALPRPITP